MPQLAQITKFMRRSGATEGDDALIRSLPWQFRRSPKHSEIRKVGESPRSAFVLLDGWAARFSLRRDGSRRITGFMLPGDICWIHAVLGAAMDHAVIAITECNYASVPASHINKAARSSASLNHALLQSKLTEDAALRVWLRGSEDASLSLAHLLCELHVRLSLAGCEEDGTFAVPATQEQIGDALGLTAVHTNRMLRLLREEGLIITHNGNITIVDVDRLRRFCAFNPSYLHVLT